MRLLLAILLLLLVAPASAQQSQGMSQALVVSSCGGSTLSSGPVTQLTMDPQGRLCQSGIGSNVCSQATAYLARTVGGNEGGNAVNITALICGLVTDGVIDGTLAGTRTCGTKLDALYIFAQQNRADALLNLCGTSYTNVDAPGSLTFTTYNGFGGFASGAYLNTSFDPTAAPSPHYVQNAASYGLWMYSVISSPNTIQMAIVADGCFTCMAVSRSGTFYGRVNNGNNTDPGLPTTITKGLFVADRAGASSVSQYQNGVSGGVQTFASGPPAANIISIGGNFTATGDAALISEAHIGTSLGATLELAFYNRLRTYMTAVGVP